MLSGLALILAAWAFWLEPASLKLNRTRLELTQWPSACSGLRIAVLADLHVGSPHNGLANLEKIVALTNAAQPDLVLLPGDFVIQGVLGGQFVAPEAAATRLQGLESTHGVFAVLGNHDWWLDPTRVQRALEAVGISVLEDASTRIQAGNCQFALVGISDFWEGPHDLAQAFSGLAEGETALAFTHNPDIFPQMPQAAALTIAGHTHGGQAYLPGIGRLVVPSAFGSRYALGHLHEDGRDLFVSSGVGTSILSVRFLVPPEVTLLDLYSRPAATLRDGATPDRHRPR